MYYSFHLVFTAARLEAELQAYQVKFPDVLLAVDDDRDELPPWTLNQQYMSFAHWFKQSPPD